MLNGKSLLITGGSGSFGQCLVRTVLARYQVQRLVVFSRDEQRQYEMAQQFPKERYPQLRWFIGDVRDRDRLYRAFDGIDYVVHAAAMKHVPACEYNPLEAVKTNILGAANVIDAAIDKGVARVLALSTDKAANPVNLYGATKLCSDKLFVAANQYAGAHRTRFSAVRYGNVLGSRGSVIPLFLARVAEGRPLPITDPRMTRFWITMQQGVDFVLASLARMEGAEVFVPKIPSMSIMDLAAAIAPGSATEVVGIRAGEKLHEVLVGEDDARHTVQLEDHYVILADRAVEQVEAWAQLRCGRVCDEGFRYASDINDEWLTLETLRRVLDEQQLLPPATP